MDAPWRRAMPMASDDLPAAVGPAMTRRSASAKAALELVPPDTDDGRAPVHVVRGERRAGERDVQRAHLVGRERIAGLDRRLAGHGRRQSLVTRGAAGDAVAGERVEGVAQAAF